MIALFRVSEKSVAGLGHDDEGDEAPGVQELELVEEKQVGKLTENCSGKALVIQV